MSINGRKHWITGGGVSRLHLIFARVFDEAGHELGIGGFLAVRDETKGLRVVRRETTMGLRGMPEGELVFENLEIAGRHGGAAASGFRRGFADLMNAYNSPARRCRHGRRWASRPARSNSRSTG